MIQKPRGTQDLFGQEAQAYSALENLIVKVLKTYHLQEIRTPIFEAKELFVRGVGADSDVVSKEMYEFLDKKGRQFVLRPEGTAPIVRALIENKLYDESNLPLRLYYGGPMFRYERPQVGRNRQFNQIGVEIFGPDNVDQDSEILALVASITQALKITNQVQLDLNFLVTGELRQKYVADLKQYLQKIPDLCQDCQTRIHSNPLRVLDCKIDGSKFDQAPNMRQYLSDSDEQYFTSLITQAKKLGIKIVLNPKLVRGLDYYTGMIFELKYLSKTLGSQATIIAGGRYNELVKNLNGPSLPAVGFAMGMERLMMVAQETKLPLIDNNELDLYAVGLTPTSKVLLQDVLFACRNAGISVETDYLDRSLKSVFKQAQKLKAKYLVVLGDQEVASKTIKIKQLATREESQIAIQDLCKFIKEKE